MPELYVVVRAVDRDDAAQLITRFSREGRDFQLTREEPLVNRSSKDQLNEVKRAEQLDAGVTS